MKKYLTIARCFWGWESLWDLQDFSFGSKSKNNNFDFKNSQFILTGKKCISGKVFCLRQRIDFMIDGSLILAQFICWLHHNITAVSIPVIQVSLNNDDGFNFECIISDRAPCLSQDLDNPSLTLSEGLDLLLLVKSFKENPGQGHYSGTPGGYSRFQLTGMIEGILGFEIFDFGIFWVGKFSQVFFG